jgi:hypothetical protein
MEGDGGRLTQRWMAMARSQGPPPVTVTLGTESAVQRGAPRFQSGPVLKLHGLARGPPPSADARCSSRRSFRIHRAPTMDDSSQIATVQRPSSTHTNNSPRSGSRERESARITRPQRVPCTCHCSLTQKQNPHATSVHTRSRRCGKRSKTPST